LISTTECRFLLFPVSLADYVTTTSEIMSESILSGKAMELYFL
jgi:hypothetical protein